MPRILAVAIVAVFASVLLALLAGPAEAIDRTYVGSGQIDYFVVPTSPSANASRLGFDGFTTELSLKVTADLSDQISANVKVCYGCHGFELDMGYFDYRVADELDFRIGRFSPEFGAFNPRHDPANHALSDKPLPYDMGRMLRLRDWNLGVLPSPFVDNGLQVGGSHWFGEKAQLDYAGYAVSGLRAAQTAQDIDFTQSRSLYYVDNNGRPTVGARASLTLKAAEDIDATLGASAMYGTFDPENRLSYAIVGADLSLRIARTNVRLEYLARREELDTSDPTKFKYAIAPENGDFFVKHGAYVEVEHPATERITLIGRLDGLYRVGNVAVESTLLRRSSVGRATVGGLFALDRRFRIKVSSELYEFSDRDASGSLVALGFHVGAVGTF